MTIDLPPELEAFVRNELESGNYDSEGEVVSRAISLLRELKTHELRKQIQVGIDELDRGESIDLEGEDALRAFFDELVDGSAQRRQAARDSGP